MAKIFGVKFSLLIEYVLSNCGLIPETAQHFTSITLKSSRSYQTPMASFIYRHIKKGLYSDYQINAFTPANPDPIIRIAYPYKALFDLLYLKSFSSTSQIKDYIFNISRINWQALSNADKKAFIKITARSNSIKMKTIVKLLKKEKIL